MKYSYYLLNSIIQIWRILLWKEVHFRNSNNSSINYFMYFVEKQYNRVISSTCFGTIHYRISVLFSFFLFIFISCKLITLQYCSVFCLTLTWISHGFTCIPHPNPPSHLPLHLIPLGLPSAPGLSTCLIHPAWTGDLFHPSGLLHSVWWAPVSSISLELIQMNYF